MIRRYKWHALVFVAALAIVLIVPATRLILLGWIACEPTLDRLPLRYHVHRLDDPDESVRNKTIRAIYQSRDCAAAAGPGVAAYLKKMRERNQPVSSYFLLEIPGSLNDMKDPPLRENSPVFVELLLCQPVDGEQAGFKYATLKLLSNYKEHDPELADALATTIWSNYLYMINGSAKILNNIDRDRLKKELIKMLQSNDKYEPHSASELIEQYCPDLEEAIPLLEKLCKTRDAYTAGAASKALRKIQEYKEQQH